MWVAKYHHGAPTKSNLEDDAFAWSRGLGSLPKVVDINQLQDGNFDTPYESFNGEGPKSAPPELFDRTLYRLRDHETLINQVKSRDALDDEFHPHNADLVTPPWISKSKDSYHGRRLQFDI
jgi:hypothetical protein